MREHLSRREPSRHPRQSFVQSTTSIYQTVTARIVEALARGVVPWRKPWRGKDQLPCNAISKRPYHGVNLLLLSLTPYTDHRWLTLRQANEIGGRIRRGERSSIAVFWKHLDITDEQDAQDGQRRCIPLLRYYHVFNAEQCEGLDLPVLMDDWNEDLKVRSERAEQVISAMPNPPKIAEGGSVACYNPPEDLVRIPKIRDFESAEAYYATMFHELAHATGHVNRLNRPGVTGAIQFGTCDYSREELVAELASAFCCAEVGIDNSPLDNAASYIHGWLAALQGDPKAVVAASSQAQRASDYILNVPPRTE